MVKAVAMTKTDDATIRDVLTSVQVIALVGASMKPERASHRVGQYLADLGYRVIPVNPGHAGQILWGETVVASLAECPAEVDMVDIFRKTEDVPPVVDAALQHLASLKVIWMQLGIAHEGAASKARAQGLVVVMDRCPKIEYPRVMGAE